MVLGTNNRVKDGHVVLVPCEIDEEGELIFNDETSSDTASSEEE